MPGRSQTTPGIAFERYQPLAHIGPVPQLLDAEMIARLAPGALLEEGARHIDHLRGMRRLVEERCAAALAEAARRARRLVLEAGDIVLALGDAKALAPAADEGRVG